MGVVDHPPLAKVAWFRFMPGVICGLSVLLALVPASRVFLRTSRVSSLQKIIIIIKITFSDSNSTRIISGPAWKPARSNVASSSNIVIKLYFSNVRAVFTWLSKINWFYISTLQDWLKKNSRHFLVQSEVKPKPTATRSHKFFCASRQLHVFAISFDSSIRFIVSFVIGQSNYFAFGFTTLNSKPLSFPAQTMKTELLTKQSDFLPVAQHGALLFSVMCELQKLHPYYRFPLDAFIQLFHDTVAERNRGKKSSGSPAARAAELVTALLRKTFERTSWSLFQSK